MKNGRFNLTKIEIKYYFSPDAREKIKYSNHGLNIKWFIVMLCQKKMFFRLNNLPALSFMDDT